MYYYPLMFKNCGLPSRCTCVGYMPSEIGSSQMTDFKGLYSKNQKQVVKVDWCERAKEDCLLSSILPKYATVNGRRFFPQYKD